MTSPEGGTSTSAVVVGVMTDAFPQELPDAEVTSIAIEYGTYTVPRCWAPCAPTTGCTSAATSSRRWARTIKADIKERFFPSGDKWREMVWSRADQTIGWALKGCTGDEEAGVSIVAPSEDSARLRLRQALHRAPLFADLDTDSMTAIESELSLLVLPGGTPLFRQGEAGRRRLRRGQRLPRRVPPRRRPGQPEEPT